MAPTEWKLSLPVARLSYFLFRIKDVHIITLHLKYFVFNLNQGQAQRERYFVTLLLMHFYCYHSSSDTCTNQSKPLLGFTSQLSFSFLSTQVIRTSKSIGNICICWSFIIITILSVSLQSTVTSFIVQVCMDFLLYVY